MKQLTVQMQKLLDENYPELDIIEVFQVFQGNCSPIVAEVMDNEENEFVIEINIGRVKIKEESRKNSKKYFYNYVLECNF